MSKIRICNAQGETVGEYEVPDELLVFDRGEQALHDAVVAYRAAQRAGTASTLTKGQVAGSNSKPWRQKGTGRARSGVRQSPIWRGGGVVFGPQPRSYRQRLPRKVARLAFRRALGDKVAAGRLLALEDGTALPGKTGELVRLLERLDAARGALLLVGAPVPDCARAARNVPRVGVECVADVHTYAILRHATLVLAPGAFPALETRLRQAAGRQS